jgi:hypothetical protein
MHVTREAARAAVDADSIILVRTRDSLTPRERGESIVAHNKLLRQRMTLLRDIGRHADLLRSYFLSLAVLAESKAPSGIGDAAKGVVNAMGEVSADIRAARVGDYSVAELTGAVTEIVVAEFRRAALEQELHARAAVLARELALQQAALQVIAAQMREDIDIMLNQQETTELVRPYVSASTLPDKWSARRRDILTTDAAETTVGRAVEAARRLRITFIALVENRVTAGDLEMLIRDINQVVAVLEGVTAKPDGS